MRRWTNDADLGTLSVPDSAKNAWRPTCICCCPASLPSGTRGHVVELDGKDAHSHWGQIQADHERDLILRAARHTVHRYTWRQLEHDHAAVAQDVLRELYAAS